MIFEFIVYDLTRGDLGGCSLCSWILDTECIHRSQLDHKMPEALPIESPFYGQRESIRDAAMFVDELLAPPQPANTLRCDPLYQRGGLDHHFLYACASNPNHFHDRFDIKSIGFFGLWDPRIEKLMYRTRTGFEVFTTPGKFHRMAII